MARVKLRAASSQQKIQRRGDVDCWVDPCSWLGSFFLPHFFSASPLHVRMPPHSCSKLVIESQIIHQSGIDPDSAFDPIHAAACPTPIKAQRLGPLAFGFVGCRELGKPARVQIPSPQSAGSWELARLGPFPPSTTIHKPTRDRKSIKHHWSELGVFRGRSVQERGPSSNGCPPERESPALA